MTVNSSLADQIRRQRIGERIAAEKGLLGLIAAVNSTVFQPDTQLEHPRGEFLWLLANLFRREVARLQDALADAAAAAADGAGRPDGEAGLGAQFKSDLRAGSALRDETQAAYSRHTGRTWRAPADRQVHSIERGTFILIAGDDAPDAGLVRRHLDGLKDKYDDLILVHTRINETDRVVSAWA